MAASIYLINIFSSISSNIGVYNSFAIRLRAKIEHLEAKIINSSNINFKKYYAHNKEYYFHYVNNKKYKNSFSNIEKANTVLNLLLTIRNRSFHWENLYKTKITNQKALAPRITTKSHNTFIGVMPNKINAFLSDLIESFEKDLNSYLK
ncbi:hypothetical protein MK501_001895 [Campylobacter coli]|nr:hypothetical protein [Campylobacter coli]EJM4860461.1 hypothetical protein [Campylobacter coli]EJP1687240.1 hypothetical protein [Campylobacter coli]EJS9947097.1 hypothetical protein [Campylobacter coli]EKD4609492.1 hypothetical protein [Campylobacter coli]